MDNSEVSNVNYHTHITSKNKWFDLKLKEVWKYRDLILLFTRRSFVVTYKQTILGPAWLFLNPLITSLIFTFVFGGIAGMSTDGIPQLLFYLTGTAIWSYFASCVTANAATFTANAGVFGKVYFPRLTTPISNVFSSIIRFGIQFIMVLGTLIYYIIKGEVSPSLWSFLIIPLVLIHLGVMGMGFGIIISSLTTKYRDLSILVGFGVQLWMYGTPIVYPLSEVSGTKLEAFIMANPVTMPIEVMRYFLLGRGTINFMYLAISLIFTFLVAIFGIMIFNKVERTFMDTV